jgi:hypothetical protein
MLQHEIWEFALAWACGATIPFFRWWRGRMGWQIGIGRLEIKFSRNFREP